MTWHFQIQYWELPWAILGVCPPQGIFRVLGITFSYYLFFRKFILCFFIFSYSILKVFVWIREMRWLSLCILHLLVGRIFSHCFRRSYLVCILGSVLLLLLLLLLLFHSMWVLHIRPGDFFHCLLSVNKSPLVSGTLLRFITNLGNVVK